MPYYILFLLAISNLSCSAQQPFEFSTEHFEEEFLTYQPIQNKAISQKDFEHGSMIIRETKKAVAEDVKGFNHSDYFNILSAFLTFQESPENIKIAFRKFSQSEGSCEYFIHFENKIKKNEKYDVVRADYQQQLEKCKAKAIPKKELNLSVYSKENQLDLVLVQCIDRINIQDQVHRNQDSKQSFDQQDDLDRQNQAAIDSLYQQHKTYIGRSLVGDQFESVMWAVIQHSNLDMMEKYLPVLQKAVEEKELDAGPFKMLLDRFYGLKYGYQIFGSQSGFNFELADDKTRKEIEQTYGLE